MKKYFGINHHENVTKDNFKLTNSLQEKHYIKIVPEAGDADFDAMIAAFKPHHLRWIDGYANWKSAFDASIGKTIELSTMFDTLTHEKMPVWENKVYLVYPEGSAKAKALLPHKRKPYIAGAQLDRITALNSLTTSIGSDASLTAIKAEIVAFYNTIFQCYEDNGAAKKAVAKASEDLEDLRIEICQALFANEGALMIKFSANPARIDTFFDVHAMRQAAKKPSDDGGMDIDLEPLEIKLLDLHFQGTEVWAFTNNGDHDACLFFSDKPDLTEVPDTYKYVRGPDETVQVDLNTIPSTYRYAYVANLSPDDEGSVNIVEV